MRIRISHETRYHYDAPVSLSQYGALTATVMTETTETDEGVLPKFSISYEFTKDLMAYASAAKGFRPGGGTGPASCPAVQVVSGRCCRKNTLPGNGRSLAIAHSTSCGTPPAASSIRAACAQI